MKLETIGMENLLTKLAKSLAGAVLLGLGIVMAGLGLSVVGLLAVFALAVAVLGVLASPFVALLQTRDELRQETVDATQAA